MKLIYLAGPYSSPNIHQIYLNIHNAGEIAIELWNMGASVICPHKNTGFSDGAITLEMIMAGDIVQLRRSDGIVVMDGWMNSTGTKEEMNISYTDNIPLFYWSNPTHKELLRAFLADRFDTLPLFMKEQRKAYKRLKEAGLLL